MVRAALGGGFKLFGFAGDVNNVQVRTISSCCVVYSAIVCCCLLSPKTTTLSNKILDFMVRVHRLLVHYIRSIRSPFR